MPRSLYSINVAWRYVNLYLLSISSLPPFYLYIFSLVIVLDLILCPLPFLSLSIPVPFHSSLFPICPPGTNLPLLHHACLRLSKPLVASRPSRCLLFLHPFGHPGRKASPTPASTAAPIAPSSHQCLSLPVPPPSAALPSPPAAGLPLTERKGRWRRWRPLHSHSPAPSPPHGPAQHPARPQHRCGPGG